jgi:hypothetical protein
MAEFKLGRFKYTWEGPWAAGRRYNPDDVVSFGSKVYVCIESHTANDDFYYDLEFLNNDTPPLLVPKWELMADGASWLGNWQPGTYYKRGDVVKIGGTTYFCVNEHTSSTPFSELSDPDSAFILDIANWTVQIDSVNWKIDWIPAAYYKVNDLVRYGGKTYICIQSHQASGDIEEGLEADIVNWEEYVISKDWKGSWQTGFRYKDRDIVKYGGIVYQCQIPHTSSVDPELGLNADLGKWSILHTSVEVKGDWVTAAVYKPQDVVKYGSYLYICNTFHISNLEPDFSKFDVFCPGFEFDNTWNSTTVYQPGDVVRYGGNLYWSLTNNINQSPEGSALNWRLLFLNSRVRGAYQPGISYLAGDVVRRGGNLYSAHRNSVNIDPDLAEDGSTVNSEYWNILIPGIRWRGEWSSGATYYSGDTVVWASSSYRCLDKHVSNMMNRPDDDPVDSTLEGRYWAKITEGNKLNTLKELGDIRTFGPTEDGSTVGYSRVTIGEQGQALMSVSGESTWDDVWDNEKVYYVAEFGEDIPTAGTSPQSPWRSIRYATDNITGPATIFVRTGIYDEILPIVVPAFVAIVGDELRSTEVRPANGALTEEYVTKIKDAGDYLSSIVGFIVRGIEIGNDDPVSPVTTKYTELTQDFTATPATDSERLAVNSLFDQFVSRLDTLNPVSTSSTNIFTVDPNRINARAQILNNKEFIKAEVTAYLQEQDPLFETPKRWDIDLDRLIDSVYYDLGYIGNFRTINAANYFVNAAYYEINKLQNMFLLRDGTGLRNMTLTGLDGELGALNTFLTRRPTAGAYASLDPGWGPQDTTTWVGTRSPYVQNVTTFGTACVGLKIDGDLHAGGNQTIVCNDFTQILSDGIGVWANGTGRTECVSVFTYYNHIGYLCTNGGKIRGTNGNCSYGEYGAVSEGFNISEVPIQATVNNQYYDSAVYQTLVDNTTGLLKLFYSNAGQNYTTASMTVVGSGLNAEVVADEFRDGAVFEARIIDPGDSSAAGGSGYVFTTNASQGGTDQTITISGSDINTPDIYRGMRIFVGSGTGTGQYGYIAEFDNVSKVVIVGKESKPTTGVVSTSSATNRISVGSTAHLEVDQPIVFVGTKYGNIVDNTIYYVKTIVNDTQIEISDTQGGAVYGLLNGPTPPATSNMVLHCVGWEHVLEGTPILALLDTTSNYFIEPRITFSSPGFTSSDTSLPNSRKWSSVAAGPNVYVAVAFDNNEFAYSSDGTNWTVGNMPASAFWTKVVYLGGVFMAFSSDGPAARSVNGAAWSSMTMPSTEQWTDAAYGEDTWVAVASGGTAAAYSTDGGLNWTASTLAEGADWNAVEYGKGKFVAIAVSDSTTTGVAVSSDGVTWTAGTLTGGAIDLAYGNNRWVAIEGGAPGATGVAISFNGTNWISGTIEAGDWRSVTYGQGLFAAVAQDNTNVALSRDGLVWEYQSIGSELWSSITFGNVNKPGSFIAVSGLSSNSTAAKKIDTGVRAQARAVVVSGRMSAINIWEPGSGYVSAPVITITDPNNSSEVAVSVRIGDGVLGNPTIVEKGNGYETTSTRIIVTGDGFRDSYQLGSEMIVENLTRVPGPGDNLRFGSIDDYVYKVLSAEILSGSAPNFTARLLIAKDLDRSESPDHGVNVTIRQLYSQVRLTGHDFLDIGLGNFEQTNYPDTLNPNGTVLAPENEVRESDGGRVFYTATDQDGNFRVGELFAVEQATGTVTLNAQFFELEGLEELRLGGVTVGGSGVVIREFSTDTTFTADSNNIVPTQRAIKAYLNRRVSGGGADAITGSLVAGVVRVGPDQLSTTTGEELVFDTLINFNGGIDGDWLVHSFFVSSGG